MVGGLGKLVTNKFLNFPRGTNRSAYTQLYVGLLLSGLLHCPSDSMIEKRVVYRSSKFFLLQAVIVTFEDFVIYIAKRLLCRVGIELKPGQAEESWAEVAVRVISYCWVTLRATLSFPVFLDGLSAVGWSSADRGPITQFLLTEWKQWA